MTKYDIRNGNQVLQKLQGSNYVNFVPNWSQENYFLAFTTIKVDMYDEQINLKGSGNNMPDITCAFFYGETNTKLPTGQWGIFGDRSARLRYRNFLTPGTELKTITFANRTSENFSVVSEIKGIYDTEFVLVRFVDNYVFLVNVEKAPAGASNAVVLQSIEYRLKTYAQNSLMAVELNHHITSIFFIGKSFIPSEDYDNIAFLGLSLCGGDQCNKCNSDYTNCLECKNNYLLVKDEYNLDDHCIKSCPNVTIHQYSTKTGTGICLDCLSNYQKDSDACYMSQNFYVEKSSATLEDAFSSVTLEVKFANSSEVLSIMSTKDKNFDWKNIFSVKKF